MAPFVWQNNKAILFYFTQNSVSKISLSLGVQRLDMASDSHEVPRLPLNQAAEMCGHEICSILQESQKSGSQAWLGSWSTLSMSFTQTTCLGGNMLNWSTDCHFTLKLICIRIKLLLKNAPKYEGIISKPKFGLPSLKTPYFLFLSTVFWIKWF